MLPIEPVPSPRGSIGESLICLQISLIYLGFILTESFYCVLSGKLCDQP